jgi:hypothetical protein
MRIVQTKVVAKLLAVAGAALLASCASVQTTATNEEIDYARVAQIERAARAFGTQVIWVNYPTKRTDAAKQ